MSITNRRQVEYSPYWKGFHHGKTSCYDQIAHGFGKTGIENRPRSSAAVFQSSQPARFHTSSGFCHPCTSPVLQDRLSRHNQDSRRASEYKRYFGHDQAAALHDPAKSSTEDAKKNIFQGMLAAIFDYARDCRLIKTQGSHVCSIDSTGMENHYVSRHFLQRKGLRTDKYRKWTKLTAVCENQSHLLASAIIGIGPGTDCRYLKP